MVATVVTICAVLLSLSQPVREKIAASIAKGERRSQERHIVPRSVCARCQRPHVQCVCHALPSQPIPTEHDILILQHPTEFRKKTISTVPLLRLVLDRVKVVVGKSFEPSSLPMVQTVLERGERPLLMFPGANAISLDDPMATRDQSIVVQQHQTNATRTHDDHHHHRRPLLILLDGTWSQARRMFRDSPQLVECCQQVQFTSTSISSSKNVYNAIRREPAENYLSTLEVCGRALECLETTTTTTTVSHLPRHHLHKALESLVQVQLAHSGNNNGSPRYQGSSDRDERRKRRQIQLELEMFGFVTNVPDLDGMTLRRLRPTDAATVQAAFSTTTTKSLGMIAEQIAREPGGCLGITLQEGGDDDDGRLVAFCLRYRTGEIGMLFVDAEYRRRGYGLVLVETLTQWILSTTCREDCVAYIKDGNRASQGVFTKAGYVPENPDQKEGTGIRRAARKWIWKR